MSLRIGRRVAAVALSIMAVAAGHASAQGEARSGFWLEVGAGTGTARNTCGGCSEVTTTYGPTTQARVGVSLSRRVMLGLEAFALNSSDLMLSPGSTPVDTENGSLAPVVLWYVGRSGIFLRGGAGLARGTFTVRSATGETVTSKRTGSALTYGVGVDVPLGRWLALTATLGSDVMAIGDVVVDGTVIDDVIATVYELSVGLTLR